MKRIASYVSLLLLLYIGGSALAVEAEIGQPINLSVRVSERTTMPGGLITLTITASDVDYLVERDGRIVDQPREQVNVTWQATGGSLRLMTPANLQPYTLSWTAPATPGYYTIFITADDEGRVFDDPPVSRVVEITVRQAGGTIVPSVRVSASPQTIVLQYGTTSTITAQVFGKDVGGKRVNFFSTAGTLSATSATTDANGVAVVRLTVSAQNLGTAVVAASYTNTTSTTTVEIIARNPSPTRPPPLPPPPTLPPYAPAFMIDVDPPSLPADGVSTATVTVRLTDGRGLGIRDQWVDFTSSLGRIQLRGRTDRYGYARVQLFAPDRPGTTLIFATAGALRSYTTAEFYSPRPAQTGSPRIFLTVTPSAVLADGVSRVIVAALVLDRDGYARSRTPVEFSSTLGTMVTPTAQTNGDGQAASYLIAPTTPGIGVVTARVDDIIAASQIVFQAPPTTAGAGLNIKQWSSQVTSLVAERWLFRQWHQEGGVNPATVSELEILGANGQLSRNVPLGADASLLRDQYGIARGYARNRDGNLAIDVLSPEGAVQRTLNLQLAPGLQVQKLQYADPSGIILVGLANPDGSKPQVYLYSETGQTLASLKDGLEAYPLLALSGEGYMAMALSGGTVRLYNPQGDIIGEGRRTDGLPATQLAIGPQGEWVAVAAELEGQTEIPARVSLFSRQGTPLFTVRVTARGLDAAGTSALIMKTTDGTQYVDITDRRVKWSMPNSYEMFLEHNGLGIIAGLRDAKTNALISRALVVQLNTGRLLASQDFNDLYAISAILPPDREQMARVITKEFVLKFPLPTVN